MEDKRCPFFSKGHCKFGKSCKFYHPARVCIHVECGYCEICDPYSIYDELCNCIPKGIGCIFGSNCKYLHNRADTIIRRPRQKYGDITIIPPDVLKIILSDCYLSDLILVCKWFEQWVNQYYPLRFFIFKDIFPELSTAMSIVRRKNDAIFQLCLRSFNSQSIEPKCKFIISVIDDKNIKIDTEQDINRLE